MKMQKWDYLEISTPLNEHPTKIWDPKTDMPSSDRARETMLMYQQYGREGWELFTVTHYGGSQTAFFKRPIK